jgi:hypothetical protein
MENQGGYIHPGRQKNNSVISRLPKINGWRLTEEMVDEDYTCQRSNLAGHRKN